MTGTTLSISSLTGPTFTCDPSSTSFVIRRRGIRGATNRINYVRNTWDIWGRVNADLPAGSTATALQAATDVAVVALESSVRDGISLVFSLGSTANLISSECVSGTHVETFEWTRGFDGVHGSGAEALLRRTFHLVVYGDFLVTNTDTFITQWQETISIIGSGGPRTVPVISLFGAVQAQQLSVFTPYYIVQRGSATGLLSAPTANPPAFLGTPSVFYLPETISASTGTPRKWGINTSTEFPVTWNYRAWTALSVASSPTGF